MILLAKFLIMWFSVSFVLYAMTCLKYKKFQRIGFPQGLIAILTAPVVLIRFIWENL